MTADPKTTDLADRDLDQVEGGRNRANPDPITPKDERRLALGYAEGWAGAGANETE